MWLHSSLEVCSHMAFYTPPLILRMIAVLAVRIYLTKSAEIGAL